MSKQAVSFWETRKSCLRGYRFPCLPVKKALGNRRRFWQKNYKIGLNQVFAMLWDSISSKLLPIVSGAIILEELIFVSLAKVVFESSLN